ncbi:MAG: 3'-5' exonuclease [Bacillota bacterium]|nr:3'-5' exonuclease [Bacillota bacterium]
MLDRFNRAKRAFLENEFKHLNAEQKQAVFAPVGEKALILRAGAGTGKTTTVVNKIAYLIKYGDAYTYEEALPAGVNEDIISEMENAVEKGENKDFSSIIAHNPVPAYRILAVTFTNKAANEMKERVENIVGPAALDMWIGTFHSICVRILRRYIDRLDGFNSNFTIYDTDDSKSVIKSCIKQLDLNEKEFTPAYLLNIISGNKNKMISPEEYLDINKGNFKAVKIAGAFDLYQRKLLANNAVDFDDIINLTLKILDENPDIAEKLSGRFRQVIVDEFQDTNDAQYELVNILSRGCTTLCAVGDDDQSIYGWRGANIDHIMQLSKTANCLTINRNYRSFESIIDVANSIIRNNKYRFDKQLKANRPGGEKTVYNCTDSDIAEGYYIADTIGQQVREGKKYSNFTVLYRTNAQSRIFEECMMRAGIPYKIIGSLRFYERQEIKDILAYLRVIANPNDTVSLRRVINLPRRGIGSATLDAIDNLSSQTGRGAFEIIKNAENYESIKRARTGLAAFAVQIEKIGIFAAENPVSDLIKFVVDSTNISVEYMKEGEDACNSRLENIGELINMAAELEEQNGDEPFTLAAFLEHMVLVSGIDEMEDDDSVTLMTVHTSKGLEFPVVFVVGLEETLFPSIRNYVENEKEIEEERRLCYVAVTRAREQLYLTCANRRMTYGKTSFNPVSRFIKEIPMELLNDVSTYTAVSVSNKNSSFDDFSSSFESGGSYRHKEQNVTPLFGKGSLPGRASEIKSFIQKEAHEGGIFATGDRVTHKKFGDGTVAGCVTSGDMTVLTVDFDVSGRKNIISTVVSKL